MVIEDGLKFEGKMAHKQSCDMAFKVKVIIYAKKGVCQERSNSGAVRKFGVDEKHVRDWQQAKDLIHNSTSV